VRDAVAGLILVSERGIAGTTYNLCNGRGATLKSVLSLLQGLAQRPFQPVSDPARLRPADDPRIVGDGSRMRSLGYSPRFSLTETVDATLAYWRSQAPKS